MIITIDVEKGLDKAQDSFLVAFNKLKGKLLILIKDIYEQSTINIILNRWKADLFPPKVGYKRISSLTTSAHYCTTW